MKIGILTLFYGNDNWGGTLQGVALKKLIEREYQSAEVDIIDYRSRTNLIYSNKIRQVMQYAPGEIVRKICEHIVKRRKSLSDRMTIRRKQLFYEFRESYRTNKHIYTDITLPELGEIYDYLIVGSDQVWNPNVARPGFFLKGVGSCCKISYAASIARNSLSTHEKAVMSPLLESFDFVSVREKTAKKILDNCLNKIVTEVLDPVLMLNANEWSELLDEKGREDEAYALAFFFSDSLCYRQDIDAFCKSKGLKLKFIPFAAQYIKNDEEGDCERIYDIGPKEFLSLFKNAAWVFTDSFHGLAFSIIFKRKFCVFERDKNSRVSKNSRLYDLLEKFELSDRMIKYPEEVMAIADKNIDFNRIDKLLVQYREDSLNFLHEAIVRHDDSRKTKRGTIEDLQKEDCSSCGLCAEVCPKNSISLKFDDQGFRYPIINKALCANCGICLKSCLNKNRVNRKTSWTYAYLGYNKIDKERCKSSSGGLFCVIAEHVIKNNGVVYGAAFDNDWTVKHIRVNDMTGLHKIMTSKYMQSDMRNIYPKIKQDLENGLLVLFSGTPCQVAAIRAFVDKSGRTDNLILIDFICHGVPSPGVWKSYLGYETKSKSVYAVNFRDKRQAGWHDYHLYIKYGDHSQLSESHETNVYMRTYLSDLNVRLSCYFCEFKDTNYAADITLGDAWKIEKEKPEWADNKGTSFFVIRSQKGAELLEQLPDTFTYAETDYDMWAMLNPSIIKATTFNIGRDFFFQQFRNQEQTDFWIKQKKVPAKIRMRYETKKILRIVGLEKIVRQRQRSF